MQIFKALLYGPDLPLAGVNVDAYFVSDYLMVQHYQLKIHVTALTARMGGFEHNELFLDWQDTAAHYWGLKPLSKDDIALAMATAPLSFKPELEKYLTRTRYLKTVWGTLGTIAAVSVLSVVVLWWQYDHFVSWAADHVSVVQEQQLGLSILEQIKENGENSVVDKGLAVKTITDIGQRLTQGSRYHYQWFVKKDKTVNAFALPGGIVIVHSALLEKTDNADELAAVLAHEVQHIEQRHALKNMINSLGWATVLMVVLGDVNTATAVLIHQVGQMYFSRDIEEEADKLGFQALLRAKISPDGMVTFFEKLQHLPGADIPAWISTHPATTERIKMIQTMIKKQPCADCRPIALDWKKIQLDPLLHKLN
jgi:Zn-dependent protease with chaperone function